MSEGWLPLTLGDCCEFISDKVPPSSLMSDEPYVGLEHIVSGIGHVAVFGSSAEVSSPVARFEPGDTLFGRLRPYLRKVALADSSGVCSPEILVLRARGEQVQPGYLHLLASSPAAIEHAVAMSAGSRMPRTSVADLASLPVHLPPLPIQRRIVDLAAHLDNHLATMGAEREALLQVLESILATWDESLASVPTVSLGSICSPRSGPSWAAAEESHEPSPDSVRVVKITNTRPDGTLDMTDETHVVGLAGSVSRLNERSLIIIRTNGNRSRIGNAYRATPETYGCAVSAFQFAAELPSVLDRDWLYWWLRVPARQQVMSEAASGTTGLGNLASGWLKLLDVPWPDSVLRASLLAPLEAVSEQARRLDDEAARLSAVRSALLHDVMSGNRIIDVGYDDLLGQVA